MGLSLQGNNSSLRLSSNRPILVSTGISTMTILVNDYSFLPTGTQYIKSTAIVFNTYDSHLAGIYYTLDGINWELYSEIFNESDVDTYINNQIAIVLNSNAQLLQTLQDLGSQLNNDGSAVNAINASLANKVDKVSGYGLSSNDYTTLEKTKLAGLSNYNDTAIYTALNNGLSTKVDKVTGYGLSSNDFTSTYKNILNNLGFLSTLNTLDYNSIYLINKPTIPVNLYDLSSDSSHRVVTDVEIASWNAKSNFSGSYNDLTNKPTIINVDISGKADKIIGGISGNFVALDNTGNIIDSGYNFNNFDIAGTATIAATNAQNNAYTYTDNSIVSILDGVNTSGNTLQKLYNLITSGFAQVNVVNIDARNSYNVPSLPFQIFVQDTGSGYWGLYNANQTGVSTNYTLISDYTTFNSVMSASAIKTAYESNSNTNAFTNDDVTKLNSLSNYTLPTASTSILGGVKIDGTTITINGSGVISSILNMTYPSVGIPNSTGSSWGTSYTVGISANNILQLDSNSKIPAVDGSQLTNLSNSQVGLSNVTNNAQIYSLNGLTSQIQTFTTNNNGTSPNFSSSDSVHTLNIPLASISSVTAGLISKSDYDSFNAKTMINGIGFVKASGTTISYDNNTYLTSYTETDPIVRAINGIVYSNGSIISAAIASNFPTLNQNTTGTAAGLSSQYINWNATSGGTSIANKPTLANVATSGAYSDLSGLPSIQSPITLTTTGTSGAATFISNTLNIPQYAGIVPTDNILHWDNTNKYYTPYVSGTTTSGVFSSWTHSGSNAADNMLSYNGGINVVSNNNTALFGFSLGSYGGYFKTNTGTKIVGFDYNGTEQSYITRDGTFVVGLIGVSSTGFYATNSSNGDGVYINNTSNGCGTNIVNGSNGTGHSINNSNIGTGIDILNASTGIAINISNASTGIAFNIYDGSINRFIVNPNVVNGSTAIAYLFDTKNSLSTSGAKLVSFKNSGVEKCYIDYQGNIYANGVLLGVGGTMVYPGSGVPNSTGSAWGTSYTVGVAANNLVQLNSSAQLPAIDGSLLTGISPTITTSTVTTGTGFLKGNGSNISFDNSAILNTIGTTKGDLITFSAASTPVRFAAGASAGNLRTDGSGNWSIDTTTYLSSLSGIALNTSKYILQGTTDSNLSNAQFLGALGTGILKNTTSTGVLSIAVAGTDYQAPLTNPVTGTGTSGQVAYMNGTSTIQSNTNLTFDGTTETLTGNKIINPTFGSEMFSSFNVSNWTLTSGWQATNDGNTDLNHNANGTTTATLIGSAPTAYNYYKITIVVSSWSADNITITYGGVAVFTINATGTYQTTILATSSAPLIFTPNNTSRVVISSISIIPVTNGEIDINGNNADQTTGIKLMNTIPSTATNQVNSPKTIIFSGTTWNGSSSDNIYFRLRYQGTPVGTTFTENGLYFDMSADGITWNNQGGFTAKQSGASYETFTAVNIVARSNLSGGTISSISSIVSYNTSYIATTLGLTTMIGGCNNTDPNSLNPKAYSAYVGNGAGVWDGAQNRKVYVGMQLRTKNNGSSAYGADMVWNYTAPNNTFDNFLTFSQNSTNGVYIGINNSTPQWNLDVGGSARLTGTQYFGGSTTSSSDYSHTIANSSGNLIYQPRVDATHAFTFNNAAGSSNIMTLDSTNIRSLFGGDIVLPKTSGNGIRVDTSTPTYPWRDLIGQIIPSTGGGSNPALSTFIGGQVSAYSFTAGKKIDQIPFHIPHDYLPGSDIFIHVHWAHNGTAISGSFIVDFYTTYAQGFNQGTSFQSEIDSTLTISTPNITTIPQYAHNISELQLSNTGGDSTHLNSANLQVDGLILVSLVTTSIPTITGGSPNAPFIFMCDIHYQSTSIGTKEKAPNFYV